MDLEKAIAKNRERNSFKKENPRAIIEHFEGLQKQGKKLPKSFSESKMFGKLSKAKALKKAKYEMPGFEGTMDKLDNLTRKASDLTSKYSKK